MFAYFVRFVWFFSAAGAGLFGFLILTPPLNWAAMLAGFLVGGIGSMVLFRRFATESQRRADLEARLHND